MKMFLRRRKLIACFVHTESKARNGDADSSILVWYTMVCYMVSSLVASSNSSTIGCVYRCKQRLLCKPPCLWACVVNLAQDHKFLSIAFFHGHWLGREHGGEAHVACKKVHAELPRC